MKKLVVDTSVAVKWINAQNEHLVHEANMIMKYAQEERIRIIMPELAKYEIANALLYKSLAPELLQTSLEDFYYLPLEFFVEDIFTSQISMKIAREFSISYYDATFIALAKVQAADLLTDNSKHQAKYKGKDIRIISLKDYK